MRNDLSILTMTGLLDARPKVGYFYTGQTVEPLLFDKLYHAKVAEIMIPPLMIEQFVSVYDAVTTLFMYDVGSLYVKNAEEELIGVLSRKDLLRFAISNSAAENTGGNDHDANAEYRHDYCRPNYFDCRYLIS